jgi:hypothetical protein
MKKDILIISALFTSLNCLGFIPEVYLQRIINGLKINHIFIPSSIEKKINQAGQKLYAQAEQKDSEKVKSFLDRCGADKCKPPYASLVDGSSSEEVASDLKKYYKALLAYQFCNEALQQDKADIAEYLGLYVHGQDWAKEIKKPLPLTDVAMFELRNKSVLSWAMKQQVISELRDQVKQDRRDDIEKFFGVKK